MIDLSKVLKEAEAVNSESHDGYPPVEKWNPDHCGDIGLEITSDGTWFYMNSPIGRERIVNLFSRILRKEDDGSYVLVTPVEKISIDVEDVPFIATYVDIMDKGKSCNLKFHTNVGDTVIACEEYPIRVEIDRKTKEPRPYVLIRSDLEAKIYRSVFYELVDIAEDHNGKFGVWSGGCFFPFMDSKELNKI